MNPHAVTTDTLVGALTERAHNPDSVFCHFIQGGNTRLITRGQLLARAKTFASFYCDSGLKSGDLLIIILKHSEDLLYSFVGALLAGVIPSFMPYRTAKQDPAHYWEDHKILFERIQPAAILTYLENAGDVGAIVDKNATHILTTPILSETRSEIEVSPSTPDSTAFLQHSSGTTGLKKGVALSHQAVLSQIRAYSHALQLRDDDCIVSWLPLYHDMGLITGLVLPAVTGVPVVMIDPFEWVQNPKTLFVAISRHRGTLCWQPNFAFHHFCRIVKPDTSLSLGSMRAWIDCSEPCRTESLMLFARKYEPMGVRESQMAVSYAMAESVFAVTQTSLGSLPHSLEVDELSLRENGEAKTVHGDGKTVSLISTGRPIKGVKVRIVDSNGSTLADDRVGEIILSGDCLFSGYFRLAETTAARLKDGWYFTGDLGFLHSDELYITGRKNDLIIVHGRSYYAHDIEHLVNKVPGILPGRNVALGWFRTEVGSEDVVIVAERSESTTEAEATALKYTIKETILDHAGLVVFDVHLVKQSWLVKTTSGKISRSENLQKYLTETQTR